MLQRGNAVSLFGQSRPISISFWYQREVYYTTWSNVLSLRFSAWSKRIILYRVEKPNEGCLEIAVVRIDPALTVDQYIRGEKNAGRAGHARLSRI